MNREQQMVNSKRRSLTSRAPEDIMRVLRERQRSLGTLVDKFEGTVERFTGDSMMPWFNDPLPARTLAAARCEWASRCATGSARSPSIGASATAHRERAHAIGAHVAERHGRQRYRLRGMAAPVCASVARQMKPAIPGQGRK
jgi:hypothetical protein